VIIPAKDVADVLGRQLEALASQRTSIHWEVVIADNGSTDRTVEVAAAWRDRLPALTIVDAGSRRGAGHARNEAVTRSSGRIPAFCDADDVVCETGVQAYDDALQEADAGGRPDAGCHSMFERSLGLVPDGRVG
jgi:glycosyltransferase involved in cell wall biosynthesis